MRNLLFLLALAPLAFARGSHSSHIVETDGGIRIEISRDSDGDSWAMFTRDGVRYVTHDLAVLAKIEAAMEGQRELGRAQRDLGRQQRELGREQARLGRQFARARSDEERNELEHEQQKLERQQQKLEGEQHALEGKQKAAEREMQRAVGRIFEDAVRDGRARRD